VALINTTGASSKIIHPQEDISLVRGIRIVVLIQEMKVCSIFPSFSKHGEVYPDLEYTYFPNKFFAVLHTSLALMPLKMWQDT
jgi:hypothetical protein